MVERAFFVAACLLASLAPPVAAWEPAGPGEDTARVKRLAESIVARSLLGDDLDPLLEALPAWFAGSGRRAESMRRRLVSRRRLLRERLGTVRDWETSDVLSDERGYLKVKVRLYETPASASGKRPFRGLSFLFAPDGDAWRVHWLGAWDPAAGSWSVLSDDPPPAGEM